MKQSYSLLFFVLLAGQLNGLGQSVSAVNASSGVYRPVFYTAKDKAANTCQYEQSGNNFEEAYQNTVGGNFEHADDITVPANQCWNISEIISSHFINGGISSLDITLYADEGGMPGEMIGQQLALTSFTQDSIGNNYGYTIYEAVLTLPESFEICGGDTGTTYWMSIMVAPLEPANTSFWEVQTITPYGSDLAENALHSGWVITSWGDFVFRLVYPIESLVETSICPGDSILLGGIYRKLPGSYNDTLSTVTGCDSVITTVLTISPEVNNSVTIDGAMLTANQAGASYQWIDCDNSNAAIAGETGQSFVAGATGHYAVVITYNGCADTSDCYEVITVGIEMNAGDKAANIYPNPSAGEFTVELRQLSDNAQIVIINSIGEVIIHEYLITKIQTIDLTGTGYGLYLARIITDGKEILKKIIIE